MMDLLRIAAFVLVAAAASPISQLTLAPSFGAILSSVNHSTMVLVSFSLGYLLQVFTSQNDRARSRTLWYTAVWSFWIPVVQYSLRGLNGGLGTTAGPILNGLLTCHSVLIPCAYAVSSTLETLHLSNKVGRIAGGILPLAVFWQLEKLLSRNLQVLPHTMSPVHLQLLLATAQALLSPSRYLLLALPAILHAAILNPHFSTPAADTALQAHNWSLVDRAWSNTGYISVLENHAEGYRVMRCGHSLLGGEWLLTPERQQKEGWKVNEPTYAVFEMLEAVRLIEVEPKVPDFSAQALVIGLGIGTAPKALITHGINATIVELDPVVHEFATQYFSLPPNHTAVIQDAVSWVSAKVARNKEEAEPKVLYDYAILDVFTGGATPLPLFATDFLLDLRALLKPKGVLALNYAGDLSLPLTKHVLRTIENAFDGQSRCKIFRDGPPPTMHENNQQKHGNSEDAIYGHPQPDSRPDKQQEDFLNVVVFCRNDDGPITFRRPTRADFLESKSRQYYLLPKPEHELPFPASNVDDFTRQNNDVKHSSQARHFPMSQVLQKGDEDVWATQQIESAVRHWQVMRSVVPDAVWDLW